MKKKSGLFKKIKIKKVKKFFKQKDIQILSVVFFVFLFLSVFVSLQYVNKIAFGLKVANYNLGGMNKNDASKYLSDIKYPETISIKDNGNLYEISTNNFNLKIDSNASVDRAYLFTRTGNIFIDLQRKLLSLLSKVNLGLDISFDEDLLLEEISRITKVSIKAPIFPEANLENGEVVISKGEVGTEVNIQKLQADIEKSISMLNKNPIMIEKTTIDPTLTQEEKEDLVTRAKKYSDKKLVLFFEYSEFVLSQEEILPFLDKNGGYFDEKIDIFAEDVSEKINREPQDSVFNFEGGKVVEFAPSKDGVETDKESLRDKIKDNLNILKDSEKETLNVEIPTIKTPPKITNKEVNDLGINTLIGRGSSTYRGSITSRVFNIGHASKMINGTIIPPGGVFSFNAVVGDISEETGFKQAYIIKDGQTVLGDGGGVCQVSTTMFRAALDAGLPIVERRAHSYRVGYYEQDLPVGYDATVYFPTTDFKFKNDTPAHILIQTIYSPKTSSLVFELYGTDDGRKSSTVNHKIWDVEPPPEDVYIDDPTLPTGEIKQIDYKAWGTKAKFDYQVVRDGKTIYEKTFYSTFTPWSAKFLRGTGPAI